MNTNETNLKSLKRRGRPKKEYSGEKLVLRIDLEESLKDDFFNIKENQGLTNNTEVIRFCIKEIASSRNYRIPESTYKAIVDLVSDPRIQEKYIVVNVTDFIERAVKEQIFKARSDKSNLHDWEYRRNLNSDSRDIANTLIDLQSNNPAWGATLEEINKIIPSKQDIESILRSFESIGLLRIMEYNNKIYYYALDRGFITEEPI